MKPPHNTPAHVLSTVIMATMFSGCSAGPDFIRPAVPDVSRYTTTALPEHTASAPVLLGDVQRFSTDVEVKEQWWRALGSPQLDALVERALQASPTVVAAQATLRQAQELASAQAGVTSYPQLDIGFTTQRQRFSPGALGQETDAREFNLFNANVGVRYTLDLAGGNRRALEALVARAEYRRYELTAARLSLVGNTVNTAVTQARLAGQIQATETLLGAQEEQLQTTIDRVRLGQAAESEVWALQTQIEQTRSTLPPLRKQHQQSTHLLAVLTGQEPGVATLPTFTLSDFTLPPELPLIIPSILVRRRPDIQAAESLLHAANAEYGVAVAKLYPQLDLRASLASQALSAGALFGGGSAIWSVVGQVTQPLFNLRLPAEKRAALAAFDAAAANYQNVVLEALRNVADILRAVEHDAHTLAALAAADAAAQDSLQSVQRQYALGAASYVQLLIAQQAAQHTSLNIVAAQAQRLLNSAALQQAMGGGISEDRT